MFSVSDVGLVREAGTIITIYLSTLLTGYSTGFSAVAVPDIKMDRRANHSYSDIQISAPQDKDLSWFASSINIGSIVGCLLGGYCGGRFGPKRTILASCLPAALGWILMAVSPDFATLIVGRVLCGLGMSFSTPNCSLLVAQYSSDQRRGGFLSLFALMIGLGILTTYCLGALLDWRFVSIVPPVLYLILFLALWRIPESPLWLLSHRGTEDCREALLWLRATEDVTEEISQIQETKEQQDHGLTMTEAFRNLSRPDIRRPFILITINMFIVTFAGDLAVIYYSVDIFQNAGVSIDKYLASIIVAAIRVTGGVVAIFLIQRLARVRLAMVSITLMSVSMAVLGGVLYIKTDSVNTPVLQVIPVICLVVYMFCFGAGVGPLQWVFLGELLPREYKVLAGVIIVLKDIPIFIVTKTFPTLLVSLSPPGTYWLFAGICLASNIFYIFFMPETRPRNGYERID